MSEMIRIQTKGSMNIEYTIQELRQQLEEQGYMLLSKEEIKEIHKTLNEVLFI